MDYSRPAGGTDEVQKSTSREDSGAPARPEIEAALDRILASRALVAAARQQALLKHIVSESLDGRGDRLKEFSIAVDVFGRASSFDPRTDSIVRVQASRLRNQLADYYASDGAGERVRIEIPPGGYQAQFSRAAAAAAETERAAAVEPEPVEAAPASRNPIVVAALWIGALLKKAPWLMPALAGAGGFALLATIASILGGGPRPGTDPVVALPSGPTVFVAQYNLIEGAPDFATGLRDGLQFELIDSLSRFPELSVLGIDTVYGSSSETAQRNSFGADFILTGSVQATASEIHVTSQLLRTSDNRFVWSVRDVAPITDASGMLEVQSRIAGEVAGQLGQPYGVIQERLKEDLSEHRAVSMEDYLCVLDAYEYSRVKSAEQHATVRACLEKAVEHSPRYSPAWAKLSWIYGDEARYAFNPRAEAESPFERARRAAEQAVAANSSSAMAHQYLAIAKFNLRDDAGFRSSIETALRLNPNNSEILADAGLMLVSLDGSQRGLEMAEKAIASNPGHPAWYYNAVAIYHLMRGDKAEAMEAARKGAEDGSPVGGYLLAAALRLNGNVALADQALEAVYATFPGVREQRAEITTSSRLPRRVVDLIFGDQAGG